MMRLTGTNFDKINGQKVKKELDSTENIFSELVLGVRGESINILKDIF